MSLISFEKPKKVRTTEEHNSIHSADSAPPGVYVPNMSEEDVKKWRGKYVSGDNERIEIRKTIGGTQLVIVVYKHPFKHNQKHPEEPWSREYEDRSEYLKAYDEYRDFYKGNHKDVHISANNKIYMTFNDYDEMVKVIEEARDLLEC